MITFDLIKGILGVAAAIISLALIAIRLVESLYELRKNPDLDSWGEVVQVVKNFFTIETYKKS